MVDGAPLGAEEEAINWKGCRMNALIGNKVDGELHLDNLTNNSYPKYLSDKQGEVDIQTLLLFPLFVDHTYETAATEINFTRYRPINL